MLINKIQLKYFRYVRKIIIEPIRERKYCNTIVVHLSQPYCNVEFKQFHWSL